LNPDQESMPANLTQALCLEALERALKKSIRLLLDAVDRTPPIISSRPLLEEALDLLMGAYSTLIMLEKGDCQE
jgi:hypothetical protein